MDRNQLLRKVEAARNAWAAATAPALDVTSQDDLYAHERKRREASEELQRHWDVLVAELSPSIARFASEGPRSPPKGDPATKG